MTTTDTHQNPLLTKRGLPKFCPSWCVGDHKAALEEGCPVESAREHISVDIGGRLDDIRNYIAKRLDRAGNGGWRMQLIQAVAPDGHERMAVVALEVHTRNAVTEDFTFLKLRLTTSEARTMAAQLVHLADREELHHYDNR